ncbi:hypothetical protein DY000_02040937 [Brassica cretica]|uniref:Uncharacterized protein n=1 Tax=Brassica cretica TaxID=69181 RepID=A0ABQ7B4I0_BRACR|nr:hypothetical protein DY000_02040937 [Brassica cretica]
MAHYPSIDTGAHHVRDVDYSNGRLTDDHHHESYAVETSIHEPGADELHEGFTYDRYLEQAPEMTIKLDHGLILRNGYRSMFTSEHQSTTKRAESPFGHSRLEAQVFTNLQDYP